MSNRLTNLPQDIIASAATKERRFSIADGSTTASSAVGDLEIAAP